MDDPLHLAEGSQHNCGNELAGQLAKEAASGSEAEIACNKIPKSAVISELKKEGEQEWQSERDASTKGAITKMFFFLL